MTPPSRPVLRYHGGKYRLRSWIVRHLPAHKTYVEPFGGAASVLLAKPRSYAEVYNDLDDEIVNLFRVLRDPALASELEGLLVLTPFARAEFDQSYEQTLEPVERARRTMIRSFMGYGANLTRPNRDGTPQRTGFRCNMTRANSTPATDWRRFPPAIAEFVERLAGVVIEKEDALKVIERFDGPETLFYVDPPYPHGTRTPASGGTHRGYRHEMTDDAHRRLSQSLRAVAGMVVLSGYPCELYDEELYPDWKRVTRGALADGAKKRTEVLWINDAAAGRLPLSLDLKATG